MSRDVFHPFGSQTTAFDIGRARSLALRPGLTTGLPFRGCEAASLHSNAFRKEQHRSEKNNRELLLSTLKRMSQTG
jgi:hypothetical protein